MTSTTIYLVRHGHAHWIPDEGRVLSPEGHAGAQHVATLLRTERLTAVYASRAPRAVQTVEPLAAAHGLAVASIDDVRERRLSREPVGDHGAAVAWCWANPEASLPGGESNVEARRRGADVIKALARQHAGEMIVVGTHGNLLALILQHWDPAIDYAFWSRLSMPDIYALTLCDAGTSNVLRRWDAGDRFVPTRADAGR